MLIEKTTSNQPSVGGGGGGRNSANSTFEFNSFVRVDMKKMSQSELYTLSRSSSDVLSSENDVVPNIESEYRRRPTGSITTTGTTPRRIYAFSHRRAPRRRVFGSDGDSQVTENLLILNTLEKLLANAEAYGSNAGRDTEVPDNRAGVRIPKRKRKPKNESELEVLGFVNVNGEPIDLKFLARGGDEAFESELNRMTVGMVREDEFLGFLNGLEGRWGSTRRRRKYVDATVFVKALPVNWKILLSLRPRVRRPVLYCRRFVSPSDEHFKSCKDVAFYLKSLFGISTANRPEVDLELGGRVHRASDPASKIDFLETNNNLIKCNICRDSFTSVVGLESHMQNYHGNDNQQLDKVTLSQKRSVPHGLLIVREPMHPPPGFKNLVKPKTVDENKDSLTRHNESKDILANGEVSSNEWKNLKTSCIWCFVEFFHEPVDAGTLASSSGFICPKCKEAVSCGVESSLVRLTQRADNC